MGCTEEECKKVLALLYRFIDSELEAPEVELIQQHLGFCLGCLHHADFERGFKDMIRRKCGESDVPAGLAERLQIRLREI